MIYDKKQTMSRSIRLIKMGKAQNETKEVKVLEPMWKQLGGGGGEGCCNSCIEGYYNHNRYNSL